MNEIPSNIKKEIVIKFLQQCNEFAKGKIFSYKRKDLLLSEETKKERWESYLDFNQHAIEELKQNKLDHWFTPNKKTK